MVIFTQTLGHFPYMVGDGRYRMEKEMKWSDRMVKMVGTCRMVIGLCS